MDTKVACIELDKKLDRWREHFDNGQTLALQGLAAVKTDVAVLSTRLDDMDADLDNFKASMGQ
jgi:hypothetical protein